MNDKLKQIGIEKGLQYECITTTISNGEKNAGAFAFKYLGYDKVFCRIFEGSKTLENIQKTKHYVVNVTQDPLVFTHATLNRLSEDFYTDDDEIAILKDTPAYMIIDVIEIEKKTPDDFPIKNNTNIYFITGKIKELVIKNPCQAFNRSFGALIETLVSFSRYKIVDDEKRKEYYERMLENERVINKVGDIETKKAMKFLKKEYEKN